MKVLSLVVSFVSLFCFNNCSKSLGNSSKSSGGPTISLGYAKGQPLAKVGDVTLTVEGISDDFIDYQGSSRGLADANSEKKQKEFVESQVNQEAMFLEGVKLGLFNDPKVRRDIKKIVIQKLMRDKLNELQNNQKFSEEELKKHYTENANLYHRPEAVKVSFLEIPFGKNKKKAKDVAMLVAKDASKTVKNANVKDFNGLASKYSKSLGDTIESNTTDYLEEASFDGKFGKNAFNSMKKLQNMGEISSATEGEKSYFVFMKTAQRKELNESFEEAKSKIERRLSFENRGKIYENYMDEIKKRHNVKIHEEKLGDLAKLIASKQEKAKENIAQNADQ